MSVPLRKNEFDEDEKEELTTADLAQGKKPAASGDTPNAELSTKERPRPVLTERQSVEKAQGAASDAWAKASSGPQITAETTPLFPNDELEELRNRWSNVQTAFVDEPRRAVEQADSLVASAMKRLAEVFAEERSNLEKQWDRGDNVSTEDLRIALQRYRSFFQRLLSI
jgi:hypothetical protein